MDPAVGDCSHLLQDIMGNIRATLICSLTTMTWRRATDYTSVASKLCMAPWGLEVPFARGGEEAARFLEQKLEETEHAATIYDIVVVFTTMRELGTFDASVDPALMNLIEQKIGQLDGALREYGERNLQTIRNGPPRETN